ncbi:pentatricopeptide repeat-containing protein at2g17210 [Phtheirospermum japonicum]|uniref:Pentatricopeptide repeat-containing protein at2g17210 n=1 Tax=Phtheirospermum japonicum TaxID=374723 RepID=A0A830D415_9LAMI|nr:pentatricopeptide repeat-containing protein at2g17210 [Phtheirospermum japonicum]
MRFPVAPSCLNLHNLCHEIKNSSSSGRWKDVLFQYIQIKRTPAHHPIDHTIFSHILKACLSLSFRLGMSVHASLIKSGFESFTSVGNSVMDFYVKSGALGSTVGVFNNMKTKDSVSWNIILHGHLDRGDFEKGLNIFTQARAFFGFEPNISTLLLVIQAYRCLRAFTDGQIFHAYLIRSGLWRLTSVQNSLLGLYTDISMDYAERLFNEIYEKDVISWSVMIGGYVHSDETITGLELFKKMVSELGIEADGQTMVSVLKGCVDLRDIRIGKLIHGFLVLRGLDYDLFVSNSLIDFYCKCGDIDSAVAMFKEMPYKNMVSWNSMLSGFVHNEKYEEALTFFALMRQSGSVADEVTLVNLLVIFKLFGDLSRCKSIHGKVIRRYLKLNDLVMNSLIDAYAKCNRIDLSWRIFCLIKKTDVVTWSTMISGFTHCGLPDEAISLYRDMRNPNTVTILSLLEACALSAEIKRSKWAHAIAIRMGLASEVVIGTAILDMYSKCGAIVASRRAFDQISIKNIVSWSAIISAYGFNGLPRDALSLLPEMESRGLKPNSVTILSVLSACCHGGLVEEGLLIFKEMANKYGSELKLEHYSCLVDLLARSGNTDDALGLIKSIPFGMKPGASAWGALLSGCRNYEDRKLVEGVFSRVLELEPSSSAGYLLASSVYAGGGSWGDASGVRGLMRERGVKVVSGYSLVHVGNRAYSFTAGDKCHPLFYLLGPVIEQLHSCMQMDMGARLNVT